jgi:hypothetical protein
MMMMMMSFSRSVMKSNHFSLFFSSSIILVRSLNLLHIRPITIIYNHIHNLLFNFT